METFKDKLHSLVEGDGLVASSLTFLSDLSMEDRATLRRDWPQLPVALRRRVTGMLVTMAEDNIELFFRPVYLIALEDGDPKVRLSAIEGLFEDNSKLTLGKLINILRMDPDRDVREAAASALGRFTYLAECGKLGSDAQPLRDALMQSASDKNEDADVRRRAIESLGYLAGDDEVRDLIAQSYERGGRQAESAVFAMGRNMDARWQQTVLDELDSDVPSMRYEAARAAGEMTLEDALPMLTLMIDDSDLEVQLAAVWALGQIGGRPAAEALTRALKSENPAMREAAQEAIQEIAFSANPLNVL